MKEKGLYLKLNLKEQNSKLMQKLNMGYIPIYLATRAYCVKSIEHDFPIEFSLNLNHPIPEMDRDDCSSCFCHTILIFVLVLVWQDCFGVGDVCLTSFSIKVPFFFPTKVSGQHILEGTHKETRVIVVIGAKGFLLC
jgi:hypothetical protein